MATGKLPTLYVTGGSGNSIKPMLVKHQLKLELDVRFVDVLAGETRRKPFIGINPLGVVPFLVLPDGTGIGESNAIAWYLAEGSRLMPTEALHRAQAVQWMIFEQIRLEPNISPARFFSFVLPDQEAAHEKDFPVWRENGNKALNHLNAHLAKHDFVTDAGYSVADIGVFGYTHMAEQGGFDLSRYPAVTAWIERVKGTPDYAPVEELLPV
ncbi:glutathione S-transferase [Betaproteobacteria bacterium]|nr:glutathione S-transferase [Betaproteobacteria bacterium]